MALNTKTFGEIVEDFAATVQARASGLVDFGVGSILRALGQAVAGVVLWLQALILALLATTRLSTSPDADADTFVADFGGPFAPGEVADFERLGAGVSNGRLTWSRLTATGSVLIPVDATAATLDGTQGFKVVADTGDGYWSDLSQGYVVPNGVSSHEVPAVALTPGSAGNVLAGTINTITSATPGLDRVTNAADFVSGLDAETTEAMRLRFRAYVQSLREATVNAILYQVARIQPGVAAVIVEGFDTDGTPRKGFVYVVVDDGTGDPPGSLVTIASTVVDAHRAAGIEWAVIAPTINLVNYAFAVTSMGDIVADRAAADAAVRSYLDTLALGETLVFNRLYQVAFDASPTISRITGLTANAGTADIAILISHVIKAGTGTVT